MTWSVPVPLPEAAAEHYRAQQRITVAALASTRRSWSRMGRDFDRSWRSVGPRTVLVVAAAQLAAARGGAEYVPAVLAETGQDDDPVGRVVPGALAGVAGDGRPLDSLLYGAVTEAKSAVAGGATPEHALARGRSWLDMAAWTAVADAARAAASVAITARPSVPGYVRMLNPPSCARCVVQAGKWFRWNAGFARHPRCDCRHVPASEDVGRDIRTSPRGYFDSLDEAEQDRIFTRAGARAIREGADIGQVVNARRGMRPAAIGGRDVLITTEGVTRRGLAGQVRAGVDEIEGRSTPSRRPRLMPEQIYAVAGDDRAEAIRLLARNGYLLDVPGEMGSSLRDVARFAATA